MQSKKFRNELFCVGDLVKPNWNEKTPHGLGVVLDVRADRWGENSITVCWQLTCVSEESPIDLEVIERALD